MASPFQSSNGAAVNKRPRDFSAKRQACTAREDQASSLPAEKFGLHNKKRLTPLIQGREALRFL